MKPLGSLVIITPIIFTIAGFMFLNYSKNRTPVDISTKMIILMLSIATGTTIGFALFIPAYFLFCLLLPNVAHDGHVSMPIGQIILGSITSLIIGIVSTIVAYLKILRWQIRKHGVLKLTDNYRVPDDRPKRNY